MKALAIFLLSNETFRIRTHVLFSRVSFTSYFRKRLSKENFLVCHYLNCAVMWPRSRERAVLRTKRGQSRTWNTQSDSVGARTSTVWICVCTGWGAHWRHRANTI